MARGALRRRSSFKPVGAGLAPGYAALIELPRRRQGSRSLWWAVVVMALAGVITVWVGR